MPQSDLYQRLHESNAAYQNNNQGVILFNKFPELFELIGPTILDVGCGNGKLCDMLSPKYEVTGMDIIENVYNRDGYEYQKVDIETGIGDKKYDTVLCFDVLEHLPEYSKLTDMIEDIADNAYISIAHYGPSQLHINVKTYDWWVDRLERWKIVRFFDRYKADSKVSVFKYEKK